MKGLREMSANPKYSTMPDEELDQLSTERFDIGVNNGMMACSGFQTKWNPTHPNSNQVERYLFPKIMEFKNRIREFEVSPLLKRICIDIDVKGIYLTQWKNDEDINRIKTIFCLIIFDKLNEVEDE